MKIGATGLVRHVGALGSAGMNIDMTGLAKHAGAHAAFSVQLALNSLAGYLFMRILAVGLGVSSEKDSFDIAYSVPFIIMNLGGLAFLHGVVTTQFVELRASKPEAAGSVFSAVLFATLAASVALMVLSALWSRPIIRLLGPGLPFELVGSTATLMTAMLPLVLLLGLSTYISAVLVAYSVPVSTEFVGIVSRAGVIGVAVAGGELGTRAIATLLVLFSLIGTAFQIWLLFKYTPIRLTSRFSLTDDNVRRMARQASGMMLAALLAQVSMSYMRRLATLDGPGTLAAISFALAIAVPLSQIFGKPLSLVLGPLYLRRKASAIGRGASRRLLVSCLTGSLFLGCVAAALLAWKAKEVVALLFAGGSFGSASVDATTRYVTPLLCSLPFSLVLWVSLYPLLSHSRAQAAAIVYNTGYVAHIVLSAVLFHGLGGVGLAWAFTLSVAVQAVIGCTLLLRERC